jgi:hypothetical protein
MDMEFAVDMGDNVFGFAVDMDMGIENILVF